MEMKVWVCETWKSDDFYEFGECITLWHKEEDAMAHGRAVADEYTDESTTGRFRVWEDIIR